MEFPDVPNWSWIAATIIGVAVYLWRNFGFKLPFGKSEPDRAVAAAPATAAALPIGTMTITTENTEPVRMNVPIVLYLSPFKETTP